HRACRDAACVGVRCAGRNRKRRREHKAAVKRWLTRQRERWIFYATQGAADASHGGIFNADDRKIAATDNTGNVYALAALNDWGVPMRVNFTRQMSVRKEGSARDKIRALVAEHLDVDVSRVTDEAHLIWRENPR